VAVAGAELDDHLHVLLVTIGGCRVEGIEGDVGGLGFDERGLVASQKILGRLADLLVQRRAELIVQERVRETRLWAVAELFNDGSARIRGEWSLRAVGRGEPRRDGRVGLVVRDAFPD
jgi:hypothetical protein